MQSIAHRVIRFSIVGRQIPWKSMASCCSHGSCSTTGSPVWGRNRIGCLEKNVADRRRHERFRIKGKALAYYRSRSPKIGEIIDIGSGGLAFSYIGSAELPKNTFELEVIFPDSTDYLDRLPCSSVSDCETAGEGCGEVGKRRCSVRFGELDKDQKDKIASLIESYCWRVEK